MTEALEVEEVALVDEVGLLLSSLTSPYGSIMVH